MSQFVPKFVAQEAWAKMIPSNVYAIALSPDEPIRFRFGMGIGLYIEISKATQGWVVNILDFETGTPSLAGKLNGEEPAVIGRTSECQVKIAQPIMSRHHVELKVWGKYVLVATDLGSTNGTYIWTDIPSINLSLPVGEQQPADVLGKRFGTDITPLLNEYSQPKGS